jgi:hypothetical protein
VLVREACLANARCRCAVCYDLVRCAAPSDVWFVDIMRLGEVARRPASVAAAQAPCRKRGAGVRPARTPPPLVGSLHDAGRGQCCALEMMARLQECCAGIRGKPAGRVDVLCATCTHHADTSSRPATCRRITPLRPRHHLQGTAVPMPSSMAAADRLRRSPRRPHTASTLPARGLCGRNTRRPPCNLAKPHDVYEPHIARGCATGEVVAVRTAAPGVSPACFADQHSYGTRQQALATACSDTTRRSLLRGSHVVVARHAQAAMQGVHHAPRSISDEPLRIMSSHHHSPAPTLLRFADAARRHVVLAMVRHAAAVRPPRPSCHACIVGAHGTRIVHLFPIDTKSSHTTIRIVVLDHDVSRSHARVRRSTIAVSPPPCGPRSMLRTSMMRASQAQRNTSIRQTNASCSPNIRNPRDDVVGPCTRPGLHQPLSSQRTNPGQPPIRLDLVRFGSIWLDLARFGSIWLDFVSLPRDHVRFCTAV